MTQEIHWPAVLTIAGSDSGGGAGIQADIKAFAANGAYGTTAITCLTAQNPDGVSQVFPVPAETVVEQARQVADFFSLRAIKTGMLFSAEIIRGVGSFLDERAMDCPVVVDPVMVATSGATLLEPHAITALREAILPRAALITPNLDEAALLLGERPEADAMADAALKIAREFGAAVLLKGGHLPGNTVRDILAEPDGTITEWTGNRISCVNTHGSGCTLAAAIAAQMGRGETVRRAAEIGREYLRRGLLAPTPTGAGTFINHFPGPGV